jgi:Asp-tRNA(Asn)/Glu-tRNA(Gln) amidotransferase B subunit
VETPSAPSLAPNFAKEREIEDRFICEDADFRYYERYINGVLDTPYMKLKEPLWFIGRPDRVFAKHCGLTIGVEDAERLIDMFHPPLDAFYYMYSACNGVDSQEVIKWLFGPVAIKLNELEAKKPSMGKVCKPWVVREFVRYLTEGKFPRHFAKDIFDILLERKPLPDDINGVLDEIIADPKFAAAEEGALDGAVAAVLAAMPEKVAEAKENPKLIQWFVGQVMKSTKGLSPALVKESLERQILG